MRQALSVEEGDDEEKSENLESLICVFVCVCMSCVRCVCHMCVRLSKQVSVRVCQCVC